MTLGGWMMLIMAVTLVGSLMTFCFYTILTETKHNHPAPLDIDTHDQER